MRDIDAELKVWTRAMRDVARESSPDVIERDAFYEQVLLVADHTR